ncbi:hypothetical protein J6590_006494 [Homalodisca vitripennis]|nr:hypothetical protein J6590_006494 [Homalodisca vitripennis]
MPYESQELTSVLPVVEIDSTTVYCINRERTSGSTLRCSPWYRRFHHYRQMLKIYSEVKNFHLLSNRLYSAPYIMKVLGEVVTIPLVFVAFYHGTKEIAAVTLYGSAIYYNFIWISVLALPILLNEWNTYRCEEFVLTVSLTLFKEEDTEIRKALCRLALSVGDSYPDSPWSLVSLDYGLLSATVEFAVLLGTTFVII